MLHTSFIELSKSALQENIAFMKKKAGDHARYSMVVKANAYGHEIEVLLPMIEDCGVDHFSVFSVAEAMRVHKLKQDCCDIMIMGFIDDDHLECAIENEVSFFIFTPERLQAAINTARTCNKPARIHLELETGMHRTGICEDQLDAVIAQIKEAGDSLFLEGLNTHLAGAESIVNHTRIIRQIENFNRLVDVLSEQGLRPRYRHVACSAGLLNYPEVTFDLVRVGIANYGFWPNEETRMRHLLNGTMQDDPLKRVLSWKSKIMSVNQVDRDEYISYGKAYLTNRSSKIATVPVGYGYGFSRDLSNNGYVLVSGRRVPVVGAVNMNMVVIDVTDLPDVKINDEVVLIGTQGDETLGVSSFSDMNNSMNYELLTRLPSHIPRIEVA